MLEDIKTPEIAEKKMIDNIMENFNFERCYFVMKTLDWKWGNDQHSPMMAELKEQGIEMMKSAIKICKEGNCHKSTYTVQSGGFKASTWKNKYGHIIDLQLEFILTSWSHDADY